MNPVRFGSMKGIDRIGFSAYGWDCVPNAETVLYIDDIYLVPIAADDRMPETKADFQTLKDSLKSYLIGNGTADQRPEETARIAAIDRRCKDLLGSMAESEDAPSLWGNSVPHSTAALSTDYTNLYTMAQAYASPRSSYYKDAALGERLRFGLSWMHAHRYGEAEWREEGWYTAVTADNWWDWMIGAPTALVHTLAVTDGLVPQEERQQYLADISRFVPQVGMNDSNKACITYVVLASAILAEDAARFANGYDAAQRLFYHTDRDVRYSTGMQEGFYSDGSYLFHGRHPMNGTYGLEHYKSLASLAVILDRGGCGFLGEQLAMAKEWFENAFLPLCHDGAIMSIVRGRYPGMERESGTTLAGALADFSAALPENDAAKIKAYLKELMQSKAVLTENLNGSQSETLLQIADDETLPPWQKQRGVTVYPFMDRAVWHGDGFSAGLAMSSSRIYNYESISGCNQNGWYMGDGMLLYYQDGFSGYDADYWKSANPYRRPGTTVDEQQRELVSIPNANAYLSGKDFVGGVSLDGKYAVCAMALESFHSEGGGKLYQKTVSLVRQSTVYHLTGDDVIRILPGEGEKRTDYRVADQNETFADASYALYPENRGVSVDAYGTVTVSPKSEDGTYLLIATIGERRLKKQIRVMRDRFTVNGREEVAASAFGTVMAEYRVENRDVVYQISPEGQGVCISTDGILRVLPNAVPGEFTVYARWLEDATFYGTKTVTVSAKSDRGGIFADADGFVVYAAPDTSYSVALSYAADFRPKSFTSAGTADIKTDADGMARIAAPAMGDGLYRASLEESTAFFALGADVLLRGDISGDAFYAALSNCCGFSYAEMAALKEKAAALSDPTRAAALCGGDPAHYPAAVLLWSYTVEYDALCAGSFASSAQRFLDIGKRTGDYGNYVKLGFTMAEDGKTCNITDQNGTARGTMDTTIWNKIKLELNFIDNTFDLSVRGKKIATGLPFDGTPGGIGKLWISNMSVDNLAIYSGVEGVKTEENLKLVTPSVYGDYDQVDAKLFVKDGAGRNYAVAIARYDKPTNALLSVDITSAAVTGEGMVCASLKNTGLKEDTYIKVMVLDGFDTLVPYMEAVPVNPAS